MCGLQHWHFYLYLIKKNTWILLYRIRLRCCYDKGDIWLDSSPSRGFARYAEVQGFIPCSVIFFCSVLFSYYLTGRVSGLRLLHCSQLFHSIWKLFYLTWSFAKHSKKSFIFYCCCFTKRMYTLYLYWFMSYRKQRTKSRFAREKYR